MPDLSLTEWGVIVSLVVACASLLVSALTLLHRRKESRRDRLQKELLMYQDIARGNQWNWRPNEGYGHPVYPRYVAWTERCIAYTPLVTEPNRAAYSRWIDWLTGRPPPGADYDGLYGEVVRLAKARVKELEELRDQL